MKTIDQDVDHKTTRSSSKVRWEAILGLFDELGPLWVSGLALLVFLPAKRGELAIDGWASVPIEFKLDT